jgi:hypothetical protein
MLCCFCLLKDKYKDKNHFLNRKKYSEIARLYQDKDNGGPMLGNPIFFAGFVFLPVPIPAL